jgi:hypothetical protein
VSNGRATGFVKLPLRINLSEAGSKAAIAG